MNKPAAYKVLKLLDHPPTKAVKYVKFSEDLNHNKDILMGFLAEPSRTKVAKEISKLVPQCLTIPDLPVQIGIEVEAERINNGFAGTYFPNAGWSATVDGSLKDSGIEFVSNPLKVVDSREALIYLWGMINTFNLGNPKFDWRSSIHIHVDCSDRDSEFIKNFLLMYLVFEDTLFEYAGKQRKRSNFCVPITDTAQDLVIKNFLHGNWSFSELVKSWKKYSALNILPLRTLGTIEFRHLEGTFDINRIITWINIISSLYVYVQKTPTEEIEKIILDINTSSNYEELKREVFGDYRKYLVDDQLSQHMSDGVKFSKLCLAPEEKWFGEIVTEQDIKHIIDKSGLLQTIVKKQKKSQFQNQSSSNGVALGGEKIEAAEYHIQDDPPIQKPKAAVDYVIEDFIVDPNEGTVKYINEHLPKGQLQKGTVSSWVEQMNQKLKVAGITQRQYVLIGNRVIFLPVANNGI